MTAGGTRHPEGGQVLYWPTRTFVSVGMTPREAWRRLLLGEITADYFAWVIDTWTPA